jgi:signal transduction histidine kinase
MSSPMPRSRPGPMEQLWPPTATVLPYVMLAFCIALMAVTKDPTRKAQVIDYVLAAVAAAWMLWMFTLHPGWRDRPRVMAVFVTVLIAIGALLIITNTVFGIFTFTIFFFVFRLPWPWRQLGAAAVAILAGTSQAYGVHKTTAAGLLMYVVIVAVNVAIACGVTWSLRISQERHDQREQALHELSKANRRLEATLAENAGLHRQLLAQAREAGILDERQRMAREIHDTLAQGLTGIITQLQAAEHACDDPTGWRRHFAAATGLARESLSEARRSVHELRPEPLETARLSEALADVAGRWSALHGISVQVTTTGTPRPIRPEGEFALLRTAQEALANVARHAQATRAGVTLSYMEHQVALDVRDDGKGFHAAQLGSGAAGSRVTANGDGGTPRSSAGGSDAGGGFGLVAMRQRIESLSGTLQVESEPGGGTGISACIPAASAEARA